MPAAPPGVGQALTLFSNKPSGRETAVLFQRRATNPANEGSLLIWQRGTFLGPRNSTCMEGAIQSSKLLCVLFSSW